MCCALLRELVVEVETLTKLDSLFVFLIIFVCPFLASVAACRADDEVENAAGSAAVEKIFYRAFAAPGSAFVEDVAEPDQNGEAGHPRYYVPEYDPAPPKQSV